MAIETSGSETAAVTVKAALLDTTRTVWVAGDTGNGGDAGSLGRDDPGVWIDGSHGRVAGVPLRH